MKLMTNDNFQLNDLRELVSGEYGSAIDFKFRDNNYTFSSEGDHVIVRLREDSIGYIKFKSFDNVRFESFEDDKNYTIEWMDELDALIMDYEV
ncbi:TPA: hypothetical protein OZI11_002482 [Staphylococcus aureus]|nr:hypothetical protein [Staphylococcus aureus]